MRGLVSALKATARQSSTRLRVANRVGQRPFGLFPPSEPYVTVSRHTAQALQSNLPFGIPGYLFLPWLLPVTPLLVRRGLLADVVGRFFVSRSMLHPSDRRDWLRLGF